MIKMQSVKRHPWDGGFKAKGDQFHATDELQARTAIALGWAERVEEKKVLKADEPVKAKEEESKTEKPRRTYTRRDMTAE